MCSRTDLKVILKSSCNGERLCGAWLLKSFQQREGQRILSYSRNRVKIEAQKASLLSVEHRATWLARIRRKDLAADATNFTEFAVTILYQVRIKLGVRNSLQGILFEFCCCFLDQTYLSVRQ